MMPLSQGQILCEICFNKEKSEAIVTEKTVEQIISKEQTSTQKKVTKSFKQLYSNVSRALNFKDKNDENSKKETSNAIMDDSYCNISDLNILKDSKSKMRRSCSMKQINYVQKKLKKNLKKKYFIIILLN